MVKLSKIASAVITMSLVWISGSMAAEAEETAFAETLPDEVRRPGIENLRTDHTVSSEEGSSKLAILHTNDIHGRGFAEAPAKDRAGSIGYAGAARIRKELEVQGYEVLMLDAGDASQGTTLVNLSKGANAFEFMNAAGYTAMAPGNHEFDWGADVLSVNALAADFPVLSANILADDTGEPFLEERMIYETESGLLIGIFGLTSPETVVRTNPRYVDGLTFLAGEELYACAQEQIDALEAQGCELIVCLGHLGIDEESAPNRSIDLIENTDGIDILVDGHSHTNMAEVIEDTLLVSTGAYFENIGVVTWEPGEPLSAEEIQMPEENRAVCYASDKGVFESYVITAEQYGREDVDVAALIEEKQSLIKEELSAVIGNSEVDLNGEKDPGVYTEETNLGDLVADAMLWQARQVYGSGIVCALSNSGSIRASVPAGDISRNSLLTVLPFENYVTVVTVTGEELLELLEAACSRAPRAAAAFPQVSGIVFSVDTSVEYEKDNAPGTRVTIESVGGAPFEAAKEYRIAVNDFMSDGGDTYRILAERYAENGSSAGVLLSDALISFVTRELDGTVGSEYAAPLGRITIR